MKTVVITGSARGFGFEMLKLFRQKNYNVVLCDVSKESLKKAEEELLMMNYKGKVLAFETDITNEEDVKKLIKETLNKVKTIDIWINNAGVNQPNKPIWELDKKTIDRLIDIDLKGTILCSKLIMEVMIEQKHGQIFNVEGHGSNDAKIVGLSLYGTAKRGLTYFTEALAKEAEELNTNVLVGKITPGIMITNFLHNALGDGEKIVLDAKTKKVYNILGDYPETIANFMVDKIINNTKNNVKFMWLTNRRAALRFMTAGFNKRNFFED
ncbi:MAG: SDR family oxidoreductase [Bacilli bacterium]|nr:SDR family oxidoreductase [Bacilli bacterium]